MELKGDFTKYAYILEEVTKLLITETEFILLIWKNKSIHLILITVFYVFDRTGSEIFGTKMKVTKLFY